MFPVTEEEKVLLRKIEMWYAANENHWSGICANAISIDWAVGCGLEEKIGEALGVGMFLESYLETDFYIGYSLKNRMLRRVWITKLLNQDVL